MNTDTQVNGSHARHVQAQCNSQHDAIVRLRAELAATAGELRMARADTQRARDELTVVKASLKLYRGAM